MNYVRRDRNNDSYEQSKYDRKNDYKQKLKGISHIIQKEDEKQF